MQKINYTFKALSPLYTGAGSVLGIKSELRKQKVKIQNSEVVKSKFASEKDRQLAMTDILSILYSQINPDYRLKRQQDIWKEFKSALISSCGSKSLSSFLTRYAERFDIGHYDTILSKYLDLFSDVEFLQYLPENADYLIMQMRIGREDKNSNYKRIKEIDKQCKSLVDILDKESSNMFFDATDTKNKLNELWAEQKQLELSKSGFVFDVDNYKQTESSLTFQKDFENVPLFSGNSIAGIMRRLAMSDYLSRLGVDSLFDFTYHTLFTGGTLTEKASDEFVIRLSEFQENIQEKLRLTLAKKSEIEGSNDEIVPEKIEKLAYYCPPLRLFGSATKGGMIESEMIVSNARLKCAENGNGDSTLYSLIQDIFYTRKDSEKTERNFEVLDTSEETHQMKYIMETLIEGSEFEHNFVLRSDNQYIYDCFHATLKLFAEYHRIGGKSARGLGNIDLSELVEQIDYDAVERYYKHLETNKKEIKEFLGV